MTNEDAAAHLNIRGKECWYADVTSFSLHRNYSAREHRTHRLHGSNAALKSTHASGREDPRSGMKGEEERREKKADRGRIKQG